MNKYKELIEKLANQLKENIPENEQEMVETFRNYLIISVKNIEESDSKFIKKDTESIKNYLEGFTEQFLGYTLERKKQYLHLDDNFEELKGISLEIYGLAVRVMQNIDTDIDIDIEEYKAKLKRLLGQVAEFNKRQALELVSEGILDLNYIANPNNGVTSLRLSRDYRKNSYGER